jgi:hypothetical protein
MSSLCVHSIAFEGLTQLNLSSSLHHLLQQPWPGTAADTPHLNFYHVSTQAVHLLLLPFLRPLPS